MSITNLNFLKNIDNNFTILFVEDNDTLLMQIINTLQKIFPNIVTAKDGEEGIELYTKYKNSKELQDIDLIISDIEMPKKNGLLMLSEIKDVSPDIPIIITRRISLKFS